MNAVRQANILVDELPDAVLIGDTEYPLETDFRAALRVILAFEDNQLTGLEKQAVLLDNLYPERPHDLQAAIEQGMKFLNGGEQDDEDAGDLPLRLYSFHKDAGLIFAAFRQSHGIDLETAEMHWWKFLALFSDLGSETTFCGLVGMRKRIKTGKATKEERALARELGDLLHVPEVDTRTLAEKEQDARLLQQIEDAKKRREAKKAAHQS